MADTDTTTEAEVQLEEVRNILRQSFRRFDETAEARVSLGLTELFLVQAEFMSDVLDEIEAVVFAGGIPR